MCKSNVMNRRNFLVNSSVFSIATVLPATRSNALFGEQMTGQDPHYFLQIIIPDGFDASYLYDARPLAMTAAKLQANYNAEDATMITGTNGNTTLVPKAFAALRPWQDSLAILNGVVMAGGFEGHDQNMNMIFTGSPFGGDSFVSWMNQAKSPLDWVQNRRLYADITNAASGVLLDSSAALQLRSSVQALNSTASDQLGFLRSRAAEAAKGSGALSASAGRMAMALDGVPSLARQLSQLDLQPEADPRNELEQSLANVRMICAFMRAGISPTGTLVIKPQDDNTDSHGSDAAKKYPAMAGQIGATLAAIFAALRATESRPGFSMLDDTTIFIGSEFSRTMRQVDHPIDDTGTDHNPLTNTFIIGGKGVKGGQVIGASDFATADETLSGAHLALDPDRLKTMGRPFDFASSRSVLDAKPESFELSHYLTVNSVTNTLLEILGVPSQYRLDLARSLPKAPVIAALRA